MPLLSLFFYFQKIFFTKYKDFIKKDNKRSVRYFSTFGFGSKVLNYLKRKYSLFQLKKYLLKNVNDGDVIIVYHSCSFYKMIKSLKRKKKVTIILEVEEIYGNVVKNKQSKNEYKIFDLVDKFIFITDLLKDKINKDNKEYCISHGTYKVEEKINSKKDNKIHIVYSGIIDKLKKGAFMACEISNYLSDKYVVHIIGFGKDSDIKELKDMIEESNKKNKCKIVFDGLKMGSEFVEYIQKCDIGLSTQDPAAEYNATSFPSKILSYMANGLRVVSIKIPAIETSKVGKCIYYYEKNDPCEIANTIMKIKTNDNYDSRVIISKLDKEFGKDICNLIGGGK